MSGADDQRAAEASDDEMEEHLFDANMRMAAEIVRLRAELAETRDRRDYLQGQLDIIYDAEYSRNDALKRRIEKMGTAGDALADAATETLRWSGLPSELWALLADARDAYRAARDAAPADEPTGLPVVLASVDDVAVPRELLESLTDDDDCWFDHHGGCQVHGYLTLNPGELCPQMELKQRLAEAARGAQT